MPELELNEDEAERLAKAAQNVARHYPTYVDPKTQAWLGLIMVAGPMYASRAIAYSARVSTETKPQPAQTATVHPFAPNKGG